MPVKQLIEGGRVPVKVFTAELEPQARVQLENVSRLPVVFGHVAAMPDVHAGIGATVGSVIPTRGAIIPAAVGVDIGCGMNALRLSLRAEQLPDGLARLRTAIECAVPVGFEERGEGDACREACAPLARGLGDIVSRHPKIAKMQRDPQKKWIRQMGSLGGGNHFIELCLDEDGFLWVMLADLVAQNKGVECRKDKGVLDEIPGAYKDIDAVMAAQSDPVEVVHTLKQIVCVKG